MFSVHFCNYKLMNTSRNASSKFFLVKNEALLLNNAWSICHYRFKMRLCSNLNITCVGTCNTSKHPVLCGPRSNFNLDTHKGFIIHKRSPPTMTPLINSLRKKCQATFKPQCFTMGYHLFSTDTSTYSIETPLLVSTVHIVKFVLRKRFQ